MAGDITVRPFRDGDIPEVLDVLRAALGEPPGLRRTPELFAWKHLDNPFGRSIMLVAEAEGRIAGFRAFMRWALETPGGDTLRCVRAVDTATHPDFQRRGVFRTLTHACLDEALADAVDLVFNTPNEKSGAGYLTMGWGRVGAIGVMVRPSWRMARRHDSWPAPEADGPTASGLVSRFDRPARGLRTARTAAYLAWRFESHPTARYVAVEADDAGALARLSIRSRRRELVLSELGGSRSARAARRAVRHLRPDYAVGWFSPSSQERTAAIAAGLIPVPGVTALSLVARPLRDLDIDVFDLANWDLSLGDLELL